MNLSPDMAALLIRFGLDLAALGLLVGWLYRSQQSVPSMPLVLCCLNGGIFVAVSVFTQGHGVISQGLGFGLFALLSMLRLRSAAFTIKDVAYTFVILIAGLVNALPTSDWALLVGANLFLITLVLVTDRHRESKPSKVMRIAIDKAYTDPSVIRAAVQERLGLDIESVEIKEIDFIKDTTDLRVSYFPDPAWGKSTSEETLDNVSPVFRY
jgi:hypothetical protein